MDGPKQWLKRGLEKFGGLIMLNTHTTAQMNRERDAVTVMFHEPVQKDKHLRPLPFPKGSRGEAVQDELLRGKSDKAAQKYEEAKADFFRGMQELSHHLRTKNRLQGVITVMPDPKYPNPFFKEALSVQDFYDRFGTGQQEMG